MTYTARPRFPLPFLLAFPAVLLWGASALAAPTSRDAEEVTAFSLFTQAMQAKLHQTYVARQETHFASAADGKQWTCIVADIARSGRRACLTYRFPPSVADLVVADDGVLLSQSEPSCHLFLLRRSPTDETDGRAALVLLGRNYSFLRRGQARIGTRLCDRIALRPRFASGPSRQCWIDHVRHLIVRTEEYDAAGRRQYISALTDIRFLSALPPSLFSLRPPAGTQVPPAPPPGEMSFAQAWAASGEIGRAPCWMPLGWQRLRSACVPRPGGARALLLHCGDGLKNVSVFEEALTPALPPLPLQQKMLTDQLVRYGQQAWVQDEGDMRVTIVGDVTLPAELGREILRALSPSAEAHLALALARTFGAKATFQSVALRRQGWGYDQIAAHLMGRRHIGDGESQARLWIAAKLNAQGQRP